MKFQRASLETCAQASGAVVAIDVLRAFSTAAYACAAGADRIILVSRVKEALELRQALPGSLAMGEVLGIRVPESSFDPNLFARGISSRQWKDLNENSRLPLLNRSLQSQYPPGSTFKIITALAALEEGVITPETTVT